MLGLHACGLHPRNNAHFPFNLIAKHSLLTSPSGIVVGCNTFIFFFIFYLPMYIAT